MVGDCAGAKQLTTDELMHAVLKQMDSANACLSELEIALQTSEHERLIAAAANLHARWVVAELLIVSLRERIACWSATLAERSHHEVARNALLAGRYFAREPLTRMWEMLTKAFLVRH